MTPALILIALSTFRLVAARSKTKIDDQIASALDATVTVLLTRPKLDPWAIAHSVLAAARWYAEQTAKTGDEQLVAEFQAVATALEGVIGNPLLADQLRDVQIDWPFLAAPGVAQQQ